MDGGTLEIKEFLGLIRRRLRLIVLTTLSILTCSLIVTTMMTPMFSASSLLLVELNRGDLLDPRLANSTAGSENARVDSEVEMLRSDASLLRVIDALDLVTTPEFIQGPGLPERVAEFLYLEEAVTPPDIARQNALERLKSLVTIQRRGVTYLIVIEARSSNGQRAAQIANTLAQIHISSQLQAKIDALQAAVQVIGNSVEMARVALADAEQRLDSFSPDTASPNAEDLTGLQERVERARLQYQTLTARSAGLDLQSGLQLADIRVVSPALPPSAPSFPNLRVILMLAGLAGLALGIALAIIRENYIGGFVSETQLGRITQLPVLGTIPLQPLQPGSVSPSQTIVDAPLAAYSEAIRGAIAGIRAIQPRSSPSSPGRRGRAVMVMSTRDGEGKTTIALSLARAYAAAGKSTLIIDCDLRTPTVHHHLDVEPDLGLIDYLSGTHADKPLSSMIIRDQDTGLSAVVGARRADVPTDQFVLGAPFERLLSAALSNFDMVIVDTPSLSSMADGHYLAGSADVIVFVVKWAATNQSTAQHAINRLQATPACPPVFMLLNQQPLRQKGSIENNN